MKIIFVPIVVAFSLFALDVCAQNKPNNVTAPMAVTPDSLPTAFDGNTRVNFIRTYTPAKTVTDPASITMQSNVVDVAISTNYTDGLQRPLQTVVRQASPDKKDIVIFNSYDNLGREARKFLPYVAGGNDGLFKQDVYQAANTYNTATFPGEQVFYGKSSFDGSPLNKVLKVMTPGNSWAGSQRGMSTKERANTIADSVGRWSISSPDISTIPVSAGFYSANQLLVQEETDEQNHLQVKYIDQKGRIVLIRKKVAANAGQGHIGWASTYFIYDEVNNLRFVIVPKAVEQIMNNWQLSNADVRNELCYQYQYDYKRRVVAQVVPGNGLTEMVYDSRDRLVYLRKANMKDKGWRVSFYDAMDRQVKTGFYTLNKSRSELQQLMDNQAAALQQGNKVLSQTGDMTVSARDRSIQVYKAGSSITFTDGFDTGANDNMDAYIEPGSTNDSYLEAVVMNPLPPEDNIEWWSYAYYDDYSWTGAAAFQGSYTGKLTDGGNPNADLAFTPVSIIRGKLTGNKLRVLGTDQWLTTTAFYNENGRPLQTISDNIAGGKDIVTSLFDFSGKMLSNYVAHTNPRSTLKPGTTMLSIVKYDHAGRITEIKKRLNDDAANDKIIVQQQFNSMGQLRKKMLGVQSNGNMLDSLVYDYNVRGWLKGINQSFVNTNNSTANKFGEILCYDFGFDSSQYNGSITGIKWKGWNDKVARAYGYKYDNLGRLTNADFNQQNTAGATWTKDKADFSVNDLTYDINGNILSMSQQGLKGAAITPVDKLAYSYVPQSNKLQGVLDAVNDPNSTLGDFKDANGTNTIDYDYDANGNLTKDLNKKITQITYNFLDKPELITVAGKGNIRYIYDAAGNKQRKIVTDNSGSTALVTTTDYIGQIIYKNDSLQMIAHEEGRVRAVYKTGSPVTMAYDYFERDHQNNVRVVLTEQADYQLYAATMETSAAPVETALFSNIDASRSAKPVGYPDDKLTDKNEFVARLNARTGGQKIGPSLVLKVTAGDTIQISTRAFYKSGGPTDKGHPLPEEMLTGLINNFSGAAPTADEHTVAGMTASPFGTTFTARDYQRLTEKDQDPQQPNKPKAYLNYVLFDDQFNMVDANSGVKQVQETPDQLQTLATDKMPVTKSGFLYVYTSNESQQDVYFDNLLLGVSLSPVMEETHYYPFGLEMAGISYNATAPLKNNYRYNGGAEWENELEVSQYSTFFRKYDPQIGRFQGVDIAAVKMYDLSPYAYANNNPISFNDPLGDETNLAEIIDNSLNGPGYGGTWSAAGGYQPFTSGTEAFMTGAAQLSAMGLWGSYGVAANYQTAATAYNASEQAQNSQSFVPPNVRYLVGVTVQYKNYDSYVRGGLEIWSQMDKSRPTDFSNYDKGNSVVSPLIIGLGLQSEMMAYGVRTSFKSAQSWWAFGKLTSSQQAWRTMAILGNEGKAFKGAIDGLGRVVFYAQVGISAYKVFDAYYTGDPNANGVLAKATLDVAIGAASVWGGPVGWTIGAIYFIGDANGWWGKDWGQPTYKE
ncbi:DUF6443 domain-containing protein [Chitinophaga eiseniae]|uniref:DUF6443 domain-containing protein n=1 Tax=Chitinophaga eiseniae TaxID=634771 RepID=A0A847SR81_9BACT|nr:DUF6443 domain-containing protein [Chitinophaga eiseniae]NLR82065.1 hypothetical protein [Chitinophaga eiseniae]